MDNNYEWQKHQANERMQKYQQEAAAHRLAAKGRDHSPGKVLLKLAMLAGIFFMLWLTVGCTAEVPTAETASQPSSWVLADRIEFQDKREAYLSVATAVDKGAGWTMAQRFQFQDTREAYLDWPGGTTHVTRMTMADRIVFQDRVMGSSR